ncbi:TonB-dependent receptor domain-containing protein [Nostoc sp.]|uniref:TonB-dependent receptor domain-containing protein n=1 Tax=Nostoc sp. TaxID=1180 RepID=UPI002FFC0DC3
MTITISQKAHKELWQEAKEITPLMTARDQSNQWDWICQYPPTLGQNVIAGYAYTDAKITEDQTYTPGNRLYNVPKNSFNLWMKYEIQSGSLKGLGFGLGLFYVGDRQGDLENDFELPSYFRTNAAIFYKQGQLRAQVNFRNLFDVDYFESASNILRVYPGEPFTVQGTISLEF